MRPNVLVLSTTTTTTTALNAAAQCDRLSHSQSVRLFALVCARLPAGRSSLRVEFMATLVARLRSDWRRYSVSVGAFSLQSSVFSRRLTALSSGHRVFHPSIHSARRRRNQPNLRRMPNHQRATTTTTTTTTRLRATTATHRNSSPIQTAAHLHWLAASELTTRPSSRSQKANQLIVSSVQFSLSLSSANFGQSARKAKQT